MEKNDGSYLSKKKVNLCDVKKNSFKNTVSEIIIPQLISFIVKFGLLFYNC